MHAIGGAACCIYPEGIGTAIYRHTDRPSASYGSLQTALAAFGDADDSRYGDPTIGLAVATGGLLQWETIKSDTCALYTPITVLVHPDSSLYNSGDEIPFTSVG